jgi:tetratricopeptide (TPR) repeat protein
MLVMIIPALSHGQLLNASIRKNDVDAVYQQAIKLVAAKKYNEALPFAKDAVDRYSDNADYNLLLGKIYILLDKPQSARRYIIKTLNENPNYKDAYYLAVNMEVVAKNTNQAIAYANRALIKYPNDLGFSIKKLSIYDQSNNYPAGDAIALKIIQSYPNNNDAKKAWAGHYEAAGRYYKGKGMLEQAQANFENALKVAPNNKEAAELLTNVSLKTSSPENALQQVNNALESQPTSYTLLMKKLGILQGLHEYSDAENVLKTLKSNYPSDSKVRSLNVGLKLEASRYYEHTDPYVLYQSVLSANPGNQEALDKLIAISMDRGVYRNALEWINKGLKLRPDDFTLLSKKADVLEILGNVTGAADIISTLWMQHTDSEPLRLKAAQLKVASGKYYISQKEYDKALSEFETALNVDPSNFDAVSGIANIYIEQKDYESALSAINVALQYKEDDEQLLLKKASVLADAGRYNEAFPVIGKLIQLHPDNPKYGAILTEQQMKAGRLLMNSNEMQQAAKQFKDVLGANPNNKDALNYIINLESGMEQYDSALLYTNNALAFYPKDKDFLLKKASILSSMGNHQEAYVIANQLRKDYPYNKTYRDAYLDNIIASGYAYQKEKKWEEALGEFQKALAISPYDTNALYASINLSNATKQPDSALALINKGLLYYGNNNFLLKQKAVTLSDMGQYDSAVVAAQLLYKNTQNEKDLDYTNFLRGKSYNQQFGIFYEQSSYGPTSFPFRILSVEYRKKQQKWDAGLRLNFGSKNSGAALQLEGDAFYKHSPTIYSHINIAVATNKDVFPVFRFAYSVTKDWKGDFATELGVRVLKLQTEVDSSVNFLGESQNYRILQNSTMVSGVLGLSKSFGYFWLSVKGYLMFDYPELSRTIRYGEKSYSEPFQDKKRFFQAYQATGRFYMNNRQEFLYLVGGLGTSPDDRSRVIQIPELSNEWLNQYVAVGYQKTFNYKTTLNGSIGWSNNKVGINTYAAQYNLNLSLIRKF